MVCTNCNSTDMKKVSLIYAAGTYQSRGGFLGFLLGTSNGLLLGRYRETSESRLAASLRPPRKAPYLSPIILWFFGFFPALSLIVNKIHGPVKGVLSLAHFLLLPACILASLLYNFVIRPGKLRAWEQRSMCLACGALTHC